MVFDILIKGGIVIDGSSRPSFISDIGIKGKRIEAVGDLSGSSARQTIDAKGLVISPGFIDVHSHSEFTIIADPRAEGKLLQGVTTEINGNCGLSAAPLIGKAIKQREDDLKELGIKERWKGFDEYFSILETRGHAINLATLVGHGNLRASVIGFDNRPPSPGEMEKMKSLLIKAVGTGAIGLSTGLIYPPGIYSDTMEIAELAKNVRLYTTHMRSEGDRLIEAIEEAVLIGKISGAHVHISHLKTSGKKNWGKLDMAFKLIEEAGATCDRYPYTAAGTDLDAVLPAWAYEGGTSEEIKRIKDISIRDRLREDIIHAHPEPSYWKGIIVSTVCSDKNRWMEGRCLSDIADRLRLEPVDAMFQILIDENLRVGAIFMSMNEDNLKRILKKPYTMIGSDSSSRSIDGITAKGKPHPRGFGTFPRVLDRYVRGGLLSFEEAIHKMTGLPARIFHLDRRGLLKEGFYADIVIFDPKDIKDKATFKEPFLYPDGIYHVFVNGRLAVYDGRPTGNHSGEIIKNQRFDL